MSANFAASWAESLVLGQFDDNRHTRQVLRQRLATRTLPRALQLGWARERDRGLLGRNRVITLTGEESQLVRVDEFAARAVPLTQQEVDRVFELLDAPLGLPRSCPPHFYRILSTTFGNLEIYLIQDRWTDEIC